MFQIANTKHTFQLLIGPGQSGGAGLPISSPRQRVQNIATAPLKFTSCQGSRRAGGGRCQGEHLSIQLARPATNWAQKNAWLKHAKQHKRTHGTTQRKTKGAKQFQLSQKEPREKEKQTQGSLMHVALPRAGGVWRDFAGGILGRQARNIPQVSRARAQVGSLAGPRATARARSRAGFWARTGAMFWAQYCVEPCVNSCGW